jgi:hypothetical protein
MGKNIKEVKLSLQKEGNFFEYHFVDMTKAEFDAQGIDYDFFTEAILPLKITEQLGIDRIVRLHGLNLLIRFIDKKQLMVEYQQKMKDFEPDIPF